MGVIVTGEELTKIPFVSYLDTNGDGTGSINANGDYSTTPETFFIQPLETEIIILHEFRIIIADDAVFSILGYGSRTELTNGIVIKVTNDSQEFLLTNSHPLLTNTDLINFCSLSQVYRLQSNDTALSGTLDADSFGTSVVLKGYTNDKLEVILNDDFSSLTEHRFSVYGHK